MKNLPTGKNPTKLYCFTYILSSNNAGALGVMVFVVGNGHGDTSSNSGPG